MTTRFATREDYERFKSGAGSGAPRAPSEQPPGGGADDLGLPPLPAGLADFVMFRRLVTPGLVAGATLVLMVLAVGAGLIVGFKGEYLTAFWCLVAAFGVRLVGESIAVVFSAVELLRQIRDGQRAAVGRS